MMADKSKAPAKQDEPQEQPEEPAARLDETVPGGKYLAEDGKTLVDANGEPIKGGK